MSVFNAKMRKEHNKINEVCLRLTAAPQPPASAPTLVSGPYPCPHPQPGAGQTIGHLMDTQTQQLNNQAQVQERQTLAGGGGVGDGAT